MNELELSSDLAKEVLTYIAFFDEELLEKIPDNFLKQLNIIAADSEKEIFIDPTKSLENQDMTEKCKEILGLIYYSYVNKE